MAKNSEVDLEITEILYEEYDGHLPKQFDREVSGCFEPLPEILEASTDYLLNEREGRQAKETTFRAPVEQRFIRHMMRSRAEGESESTRSAGR